MVVSHLRMKHSAGQGITEYLVIVFLVAVVVLVSVRVFGKSVNCQFRNATSSMDGSNVDGCNSSASPAEPEVAAKPINFVPPAQASFAPPQVAAQQVAPPPPPPALAIPPAASTVEPTPPLAPPAPPPAPPPPAPSESPTATPVDVLPPATPPTETPSPTPEPTPTIPTECYQNYTSGTCSWYYYNGGYGCGNFRTTDYSVTCAPLHAVRTDVVANGGFRLFCNQFRSEGVCNAAVPTSYSVAIAPSSCIGRCN